ncbi:hypothetical protein [Methanosarcina acetivorans]|uniref:Uncharacterized protein n=1 Tax=Methanosarcina acetivorans (strain ATCC 35395 / DSM 2834 / JCM 12185 / C2A) TaxID=188937 RepID=Q8TR19_METAC|nr:hypothetical protein [Methanosarcina acetivorans]AAM04781.1 predicted protein [Methanosarcina acetivorans C2A]
MNSFIKNIASLKLHFLAKPNLSAKIRFSIENYITLLKVPSEICRDSEIGVSRSPDMQQARISFFLSGRYLPGFYLFTFRAELLGGSRK